MNKVNKNPKTAQSKTAEHLGREYEQFTDSSFVVAKIAGLPEAPDSYYNPRSRIIALRYQSNIYWAFYVTDFEFPDPAKHDLLWLKMNKVDEQPENKVIPDEYPDIMSISLAFAIRRLQVPNLADSTSIAAMDAGYRRDSQEDLVVYPGRMETDGAERTGLTFGKRSGHVTLKGPNTEIILTDEGIHMNGNIINHDMGHKAIFKENPLGFLVPETLVTFPVSFKYMPSMDLIENVGSMLETLGDLRSLLTLSKEL